MNTKTLPPSTSKDFPQALKAAREAKGMSRAELAHAVNIHQVMPRRYEEPDCGEFTRPRPATWLALNRVLGFEPDEASAKAEQASETPVLLREATIEDIVAELHRRSIVPAFTFPI